MAIHKTLARKARWTGNRFVAVSNDVIVGTGDTLSDLLLLQAVTEIDYGQILEVAGDAAGATVDVVGDIIDGAADLIGDLP